jgi:predicted dehydrogenase
MVVKKALVIGTGSVAQKHIKILISLSYKVYVYSKSNKKFFKNNQKINRLINLTNLIDFEFSIIANKTSDHLDVLKILINEKIHIYCEKPIFHKKFEYKTLRDRIKKKKIVFHSGYQLRNDSKIIYIQRKLKKLKIRSCQVSVGHDFIKWRKNGVMKNSYFSNVQKGGGVIFELVHEVDLINLLFGKIKTINTLKSNSKKFNCEDVAVSIIETEKKIIGTLYQDMVSNIFFRNIKIIANNAFFIIDLVENKITENEKVKYFKDLNEQPNLLKKNILLFKKKIMKKDYSLTDYDNAVLDLAVCLKMHNEK